MELGVYNFFIKYNRQFILFLYEYHANIVKINNTAWLIICMRRIKV